MKHTRFATSSEIWRPYKIMIVSRNVKRFLRKYGEVIAQKNFVAIIPISVGHRLSPISFISYMKWFYRDRVARRTRNRKWK